MVQRSMTMSEVESEKQKWSENRALTNLAMVAMIRYVYCLRRGRSRMFADIRELTFGLLA